MSSYSDLMDHLISNIEDTVIALDKARADRLAHASRAQEALADSIQDHQVKRDHGALLIDAQAALTQAHSAQADCARLTERLALLRVLKGLADKLPQVDDTRLLKLSEEADIVIALRQALDRAPLPGVNAYEVILLPLIYEQIAPYVIAHADDLVARAHTRRLAGP